jgi:hypothetical protein
MQQVVPNLELKQKIDEWIKGKREAGHPKIPNEN